MTHSILVSVTSPGTSLGTGGMVTKLVAAELATATGCTTVITNGSDPKLIPILINDYEKYLKSSDEKDITNGTFFVAKERKLDNVKW